MGKRTRRSARRTKLVKIVCDPALAKRLEDNLAKRAAFATKLEADVVQNEVGTNPSTRARQDEAAPQDSVDMQTSGKRLLDPGGDDKVCGLDLCDELDECSA